MTEEKVWVRKGKRAREGGRDPTYNPCGQILTTTSLHLKELAGLSLQIVLPMLATTSCLCET